MIPYSLTPYALTLPSHEVVVVFVPGPLTLPYLDGLSAAEFGHPVFGYCVGFLVKATEAQRATLRRFYLNTPAEWDRLRLAVYDDLYVTMDL